MVNLELNSVIIDLRSDTDYEVCIRDALLHKMKKYFSEIVIINSFWICRMLSAEFYIFKKEKKEVNFMLI